MRHSHLALVLLAAIPASGQAAQLIDWSPPREQAEETWDAHAAAAVLDASFETAEACEARLAQARAAESTPSADIDPRLRDLFTHARCTPVEAGAAYAMRLHWPEPEEEVAG